MVRSSVVSILVCLFLFSATCGRAEESLEETEGAEDTLGQTTEAAETEGSEKEDESSNGDDDEVKEEDDVLIVTTKNFDSIVKEKDIILVEFYAPWLVYSSCLLFSLHYIHAPVYCILKESEIVCLCGRCSFTRQR